MNQLLTDLQRLLKPEESKEGHDEGGLSTSTAAHPADEETEMLHPGKRRLKENYTSHWDLDYLPRAEVDRIMGGIASDRQGDEGNSG